MGLGSLGTGALWRSEAGSMEASAEEEQAVLDSITNMGQANGQPVPRCVPCGESVGDRS